MRNLKDNPGNPPRPVFRAGDRVRESGIYQVVHGSEHRAAQRGVMVRGRIFPSCKECHDQVRYLLLEPALYILEDEDFSPAR